MRIKLFETYKDEVLTLEKKLITRTNTQTYSIIEETFQATKDLDQNFKQELIDRSELMDPTKRLKLCSLDFTQMKKEFLRDEDVIF